MLNVRGRHWRNYDLYGALKRTSEINCFARANLSHGALPHPSTNVTAQFVKKKKNMNIKKKKKMFYLIYTWNEWISSVHYASNKWELFK